MKTFRAGVSGRVLYLLFFTVQLFFNFDFGNQDIHIVMPVLSAKDHQKINYRGCKKAAVPSAKKVYFRLNKRYQPQPAISCGSIIIEPLVCHVSSKRHIHYSRGFISSPLLCVLLLRGPPYVV